MSILREKSFSFSIRIVNLYRFLAEDKKEFVLSKQILRSGTSIGANLSEAEFSQSTADMVSKYTIALKEANETKYWIELLNATDYIDDVQCSSIKNDCIELVKLLVSSVKTLKSKL